MSIRFVNYPEAEPKHSQYDIGTFVPFVKHVTELARINVRIVATPA